jgi:HSP20 family protein
MAYISTRDPLFTVLNHILTVPDGYESSKTPTNAAQSYVRDTRAQACTAVDVKELPNAYVFIADMPGLKSSDIKVQVENDNVLTISGERKREEPSEGTNYLQLERPAGKFLRKFTLPQNADLNNISATCSDGVLSLNVPKLPPPEPQKPKTINITVG